MTTIPTIDQITGNTVMQKFRSLARAVIDTLTSFGERTDYIVSDLAPRLEANLQTLSVKLVELNNTLNTTQSLQEHVTNLANEVNATLDNIVRKDTPTTITALLTLANGLAVTGTTTIDGDVHITNGHSMSVAGDVDVANDLDVSGNAIIRGNTEVGGMAIEESGNKTILSNANGISVTSQFDVPTTSTSSRDTKAVNGTRLQNDLDNYAQMLRTTGSQSKAGQIIFVGNRPIESAIQGGWNLINAKESTVPTGTLNYDMIRESAPDGSVLIQNRYQIGANNEFSRIYFSLSHVINGERKYTDFVFESGLGYSKFYIVRQRADGTTGSTTIASVGESD